MKPAKMTKMRKQNCPACGVLLNAASDPLNECSPAPGDITVCCNCRTILAFGEAMDLRMANKEELIEVADELNRITGRLNKTKYSLLNTPNGPGLLCHQCGHSNCNPHDIDNLYCGFCHQFLADI
jgi:hypothetical protein